MKKKAWIFVLFLTIVTSLVTGTYAVYTKSFVFNGNITKVSKAIPPAPTADEDIINGGDKVNKDDAGNVSIKERGDFLHLTTLPGQEYKIDVDISNYKDLNAFGVYIDGYYDEETHTVYADVVQFVNGKIEIKRRTLERSYDLKGNLIITEGEDTYSSIATASDTAAILPSIPSEVHMSVIVNTKTDANGNLVKVPEVYLNDTIVPNQQYPQRTIMRADNQAYIGYRSWYGGQPDVQFKNLTISALEAPLPEMPNVIITGMGEGSNISDNGNGITITNSGDYLYPVDGIGDSYVISAYVQVDNGEANANMEDDLKGFGLYIDGSSSETGAVSTDCLYFTNTDGAQSLLLTTYDMNPSLLNNAWVFDKVTHGNDAQVTTQGELGLAWDGAKNGFNLYIAIKGDPSSGTKKIRVFTSDMNQNFNESFSYYDTPWTGKPPLRPFYKQGDRIYVGFHANNHDSRSIIFHDLQVTSGLDRIPADLLNKRDW